MNLLIDLAAWLDGYFDLYQGFAYVMVDNITSIVLPSLSTVIKAPFCAVLCLVPMMQWRIFGDFYYFLFDSFFFLKKKFQKSK